MPGLSTVHCIAGEYACLSFTVSPTCCRGMATVERTGDLCSRNDSVVDAVAAAVTALKAIIAIFVLNMVLSFNPVSECISRRYTFILSIIYGWCTDMSLYNFFKIFFDISPISSLMPLDLIALDTSSSTMDLSSLAIMRFISALSVFVSSSTMISRNLDLVIFMLLISSVL